MLENLEILSLVIMRVRNQLAIVGFLCIFLSCSTSKQLVSNTKSDEGVIRYEKKYDSILIPITTLTLSSIQITMASF